MWMLAQLFGCNGIDVDVRERADRCRYVTHIFPKQIECYIAVFVLIDNRKAGYFLVT